MEALERENDARVLPVAWKRDAQMLNTSIQQIHNWLRSQEKTFEDPFSVESLVRPTKQDIDQASTMLAALREEQMVTVEQAKESVEEENVGFSVLHIHLGLMLKPM
ncbi:hypothetical protein L2E82_30376 [Cichorium intybus]|uniref:Uncharacterized protein n=1 Tax=Cichorium intybus TaxID=13427 RepID=A0ACB9D0X1_CICIN|nr:hypothetical protein L2E82_30376 [Cichorium intybus]